VIELSLKSLQVGAVVGEMIGSSRGLGWYVNHSSGVYDMTGAITALFVLMLMAMAFNGLLALIERQVLHWRSASDSWMLK
jgi:NitT/TauT family transport system permease protein